MRLRSFMLVLFCAGGAAAAWACSLNPQPLPPDNPDAAIDGAIQASPDAAGGGVDGGTNDAEPTNGDAAMQPDATNDASEDASDASTGGESDASDDAGEDG